MCFFVQLPTLLEVIEMFLQFHCSSSFRNDWFPSMVTGRSRLSGQSQKRSVCVRCQSAYRMYMSPQTYWVYDGLTIVRQLNRLTSQQAE